MEDAAFAIDYVLRGWGSQIGGLFLSPGSSHSLAALACTLALAAMLAVPANRKRRTRLRALLRAVFPRRLWRSASGRADIAFFVGGLLLASFAIGWAIFSAEQVRQLIGARIGTGTVWLPQWANLGIATAALFLAYEFAYWLDHWLMHRVPLLWRFHKVHHQAESLSLFTNARVHPVETIGFYNLLALVSGSTAALLDRILGASDPWQLGGANLLILLAAVLVTHLQHSHFWFDFGPLNRMLLGPAHHQIHHSSDPRHFNTNLGSTLTLFDRLFGTLHLPQRERESLRFGVEDGTRNPHGLHAALIAPFTDGLREPDQKFEASTSPAR